MTTPTPQFNGQSDPQYTNQEQAYAQQGQPYGQPTFATSVPAGYQQKSKIIAGILGIFLGGFGIHNFYLGRHHPRCHSAGSDNLHLRYCLPVGLH